MEQLIELFRRLLLLTDTSYIRYLYDKIDWSARMIGIVGPRGVGKTTMLLQRIKLNHSLDDTLFINADDLYFAEHRLFDLAIKTGEDIFLLMKCINIRSGLRN